MVIEKPIVLIVDDVPSNAMILAACLKDDYKIKVAKSGQQCLDIVATGKQPDLILLDIEMPGLSGYDVCEKLQQEVNTKQIPIIFVTGRDDDLDQEKGLGLGAVDYIIKPFRSAIVVARVKTHITLKQQRDKLLSLAMQDQLTGLYNRHYLMQISKQKMAQALRHKEPLSLLMIDVDNFKAVNDNHGHDVGDEVLMVIANTLLRETRTEDIVARFGGEEFIILLDHCDLDFAIKKAEMLLEKVALAKPNNITVTVSIGVTEYDVSDNELSSFTKRADIALYHAKENGRNQYAVLPAPAPETVLKRRTS